MSQIVVLGMHRSGTSMIAGILTKLGIFMGRQFIGPSESNEEGHFEAVEFVELNEAILQLAGATWDNVPTREQVAEVARDNPLLLERIEWQVTAYDALFGAVGKPWGWKDPRTVLTIDCYTPYLTDPLYVAVFREPNAVIKSLMHREPQMTWEQADLIDAIYGWRLAEFLDDKKRIQVQYEDVLEEPAESVKRIADCVGVPFRQEAVDIIRPDLNHARSDK